MPEPSTWEPEVHVEEAGVSVTFYTYSGLGIERITRHIDTFVLGRYTFKTTIAVVAEGSGGYVF